MAEYGDLFEYGPSMMTFEFLNLAFFALCGLALVWIAAHPQSRDFGTIAHDGLA